MKEQKNCMPVGDYFIPEIKLLPIDFLHICARKFLQNTYKQFNLKYCFLTLQKL